MFYEINIALNGQHFFATHERSLTDRRKAKIVWRELKKKFPEKEGYSLTASLRINSGTTADLDSE